MSCIVDKKETGEVYTSCVLDYGKPDDCGEAVSLQKQGKSKRQCKYWISDKNLVKALEDAALANEDENIKNLLIDAANALRT